MTQTLILRNGHLADLGKDILYHLGLPREDVNMSAIFGDVKFVCTGGSPRRFEMYAKEFAKDTGLKCSENMSQSDRFVMYKTGPVLWINHGMGSPSLSIMLNEIIKLLHYAKASDVTFIRLGTSGGVGVEPGTVIVSSGTLNGALQEAHFQYIKGELVVRPAPLDQDLKQSLFELAKRLRLPVDTGKTLCADDFYEGQMRLDGAFCDYTSEDKFAFLKKLYAIGVRNIEMESSCFASFTHRAGIRAAIVCVALINRMKGDQVVVGVDKSTYVEFETRPFKLVTAYIKEQLKIGA